MYFKNTTLTGFLGLVCFLSSGVAQAATSTTEWGARPTWATPESELRPARQRIKRPSEPERSPFAPGTHNISLDIGQIFLVGGLSEKYTDNLGFQTHYTYGVSDIFAFDASFGYSNHNNNAFSLMTGLTGLRMNLHWFDRIVPNGIFGLGFYRLSYSLPGGGSVDPVLFGLHIGLGVDLLVTKRLFFGTSLTLNNIFGSERRLDDGGTLNVGGTFLSFLIRAGVSI